MRAFMYSNFAQIYNRWDNYGSCAYRIARLPASSSDAESPRFDRPPNIQSRTPDGLESPHTAAQPPSTHDLLAIQYAFPVHG